MISYLRIAVDHDNGEAWFTDGSVRELKQWSAECGLFGADITKDIMYHAESLYAEAMDTWREQVVTAQKDVNQ